jgi:hypothetical protein
LSRLLGEAVLRRVLGFSKCLFIIASFGKPLREARLRFHLSGMDCGSE